MNEKEDPVMVLAGEVNECVIMLAGVADEMKVIADAVARGISIYAEDSSNHAGLAAIASAIDRLAEAVLYHAKKDDSREVVDYHEVRPPKPVLYRAPRETDPKP